MIPGFMGLGVLMISTETKAPLYTAYLLKEDLRMFWNLPNSEAGKAFLDDWTEVARTLGNCHFVKFADTIVATSSNWPIPWIPTNQACWPTSNTAYPLDRWRG